MYLTKKHLSRRTVLRAAGVSLGLPLLDAMIPAATALAQTAAAPKLRAGFFYLPHGAIMWNTPYGPEMDHWSPSGAGADFKLSRILGAARVPQALRNVVRKYREQGAPGLGAHARACHVAQRRAAEREGDRRDDGADDRPNDRGAHRAGHGAAVARGGLGNDDSERRVRRPALATTARRCRSAIPRRRCRWSSIRARCSCSFSAPATRPRSAKRSRVAGRACST